MFKNYLLTAWRNLIHSRIYSVINIAGLSLGLTCVMLIVLYVKDEVSFDRFHKGVENIYRVTVGMNDPRFVGVKFGITGFLQGPRFTAKIPGIGTFVRVRNTHIDVRTKDGVKTIPTLYADSNFFSVFTFPLLRGDANTALAEPGDVVLSEDEARRQFGTADAVGKVLYLKEDSVFRPYSVTAVAKRVPQNSSIQFDVLIRLVQPKGVEMDPSNWFSFFLSTYVVLHPHADKRMIEAGMERVYREDAKDLIANMEKRGKMTDKTSFGLQAFPDMHLGTDVSHEELAEASNPLYSYILSGIAVFILLIAAINFINLTVAQSLKRSKEIGVRKVLGGDRRQLMLQFLGEAFLLCLAAFVTAVMLTRALLPLFNQLSNKALSISFLLDGRLIAAYIGLFVLTALLAGFYPALVISGFNPVQALYSRQKLGGGSWLQKTLVVLQFGLASFLIIGTVVIFAQFRYLTTEKLGYDDRGLVLVKKLGLTAREIGMLRNEMEKNPDVIGVAPKDGWFAFTA